MFSTIKEFIKKVINKMFNKDSIQKAVNVDIAMTNEMYEKKQLWQQIYEDKAPWLSNTVSSMNLGTGIASELARLVTIEFKSEISNNEFLNKEYQKVIDNIRIYTEYACSGGGVCFKPYVSDGHIKVDVVQAINFFPTAFNGENITGCILPETMTKGDTTYIRIEYHNFNNGEHTIINRAFKQKNVGNFNMATQSLGDEIQLAEVEEWANITPEFTVRKVDRPLFSYFKMPLANTIDTTSPEGVSVYARVAKDMLRKADEQYSRIIWEYESKETAIDVSTDFFKKDNEGKPILPTGKERLYRALNIETGANGKTSGWNSYSPDIRDVSMFNGLNELIRQIEFLCGLAYGTISKEVETAKTATEIKTSKQRSYQMVKDIQKSLRIALENLAYAMSVWGQIAKLGVTPVILEGENTDVSFDFDDSIIIDKEMELDKMFADASAGIIKNEYYIMKRYGVTFEEAKKMMPDQVEVKPSLFPQE